MKRWICLGLCLCLAFLCGCAAPNNTEGLSVVSTIFPYYDFAKEIAGAGGQVTMLLSPGGEVHGFEPTLEDLRAIETCDVFLYNGGEGDGWVEDLLQGMDVSNKQVVRLMDHVELLAVGEEEHHHHHDHGLEEADEHIFTTPKNALQIAKVICDAMKKADPAQSERFENNYARLQQNLQKLEQDYEGLRQGKGCLVVADRFPFLYLTQEYHLSYVAAFSGCSSNTEADLKTIYELKTAAQKQGATPIVFCTEFSDQKLANTVAQSLGGQVKVWHSCHNVTQEQWEQQVTYVALMEQNLKEMKEALLL